MSSVSENLLARRKSLCAWAAQSRDRISTHHEGIAEEAAKIAGFQAEISEIDRVMDFLTSSNAVAGDDGPEQITSRHFHPGTQGNPGTMITITTAKEAQS